jgi:hypothetical protein
MNSLMRWWSDARHPSSDCSWLDSRIGDYLEGALGPRAMTRANNHLDECPSCQRSASLLEDSLRAARDIRSVAPGFDFEEAVWEKIRISREIQRQPGMWARVRATPLAWWGGGAVAFTAAAAATFYFLVLSGPATGPATLAADHAKAAATAPSTGEVASTAPIPEAGHAHTPATGFLASAPQAGDEKAPPAGPEETVASTTGAARLEPGDSEELYVQDIQWVPDPYSPDRSYPVTSVQARPGTARMSF